MVSAINPDKPLLSVVIPTCNRTEHLERCVLAITAQASLLNNRTEIIVSDDAADLIAKELFTAQYPELRWVTGPKRGPGANRNVGAAMATGTLLVFVDDDCEPQPGWLAAYASAAEKKLPSMVFVGPTRWPTRVPSLRWEAPLNEGTDCMPSCNFAIGREKFLSVGGFDERYQPAFEDMELQARLLASGCTIELLPNAVVLHAPRPIPNGRVLAARWRPQVIYALDLGAPARRLYFPYLRHVAGVILSRLRESPPRAANLCVLPIYLMELLHVVLCLRGWIRDLTKQPRSRFWADEEHRAHVRGFGFGAKNLKGVE